MGFLVVSAWAIWIVVSVLRRLSVHPGERAAERPTGGGLH